MAEEQTHAYQRFLVDNQGALSVDKKVVEEIGARAVGRGEPVDPGRLALLGSVLEAFWWQRYTATGDGGMSEDQVERVVDDVLLPIVSAAPARV